MRNGDKGNPINKCQWTNKYFLRKVSGTSLKAFAIFVTAILLLSAFAVADMEYYIEVDDDLPWEHTFYPGPLGNYAKLTFKNATSDTPLVVRFENVTTNTTLVCDGQNVGDIEANITNFYIFTVENGTEPYLRFFVTDGLKVKINKIEKSKVGNINKSHVFGETFYKLGGKYLADLSFESLEAKHITLNASGNISYVGIIEFPAFVDSVCRYGEINDTTTSFILPSGTKTLRIVSESVEEFDMKIIPTKMEDVAVIDVIAIRQSDGASKYVRTITPIGQFYGVKLHCDDPINTVAANSSTVFTIAVENTGNGNDTIDLEVENEWNATFIEPVVEIANPGFECAYLVVTAPPNSEEESKTIQVNATSRGNQSIKSTINVTVNSKSPSYDFDFNCSETEKEIYPKQSAWYHLSINNTGNVEDTYDFEILSGPNNWGMSFDEDTIRVDTNDTATVRLMVTPPINAISGTYYIEINVTSHNITESPQSLNLTARVVKVYGVDLSPNYQIKDDCPLSTEVVFLFLVQNSGNSPDIIDLSIPQGQGWFADENGTQVDPSIYIDPWEGVTIYLHTDTVNTYNAVQTVKIKGTSQNKSTISETITVETHTIKMGDSPNGDGDDWAVSMPLVEPGDAIIPAENNENLTFEINITNNGDYPDNFTITKEMKYSKLTQELFDRNYNQSRNEIIIDQTLIDSIYPLEYDAWSPLSENDPWDSEIYIVNLSNPYRIFLDVNESKTLHLNVSVANNAPLGEMSGIKIKVNSTGNSSAYDVFKKYFILTKSNITQEIGDDFDEIFPYGAYPQMNNNALFNLFCVEPISPALPGNTTTYHIHISNDDDFDMYFNLTTYGVPDGWNASLDNNSISIEKFSLAEVNLTVTAPQDGVLPSDQDIDGLANTLEINSYNTSILNPDTDNDMFWDGAEVNYWLLRGLSAENISPYLNNNDIDGDGLLDGDEVLQVTNINGSSDNDTLSDFYEVHQYFTYEKKDINMDYYPPPPFNISIEFEIDVEDDYRLMVDIRNQINATITDINETESTINQIMENITTAKISGEEVYFNTFGIPMEIKDSGNGSFNVTDNRYYAIYERFESDNYNLTLQIDPSPYENTTIYSINVSTFLIQRHGLDPFDEDVDDDGLNDSYEVYRGINPFKIDSDEDGLSDYDEVAIYNSNPTKIDTDNDGLADGYNKTIKGISYEGELSYGTNSTNPDTDGDELSDGNNITIAGVDWIGELAIGTNPNIWDTDSDTMPDGWENKYGLNPLDSNDADSDNDNGGGDGLTNAQEYTVGTDPTDNDLDDDNLTDGNEITGVLFRTNVTKGADRIDHYIDYYQNQTGFKWIFYNGSNYEFKDGYTNVSNTSSARYNGSDIVLISVLSDGATLIYNKTTDEVYVWEPGSDFDDSDQNGTLEGTFYAFNSSNSSEPITSDEPEPGYKYQEIYEGTSPWINDTDEDGIFDGDEKDCLSDTDNDGLQNNLDTDSDNDGVVDGEEIGWDQNSDGDSILYNMLDPDSDDDGISDGTESLWYLDIDKDGLENMIDSDSDNDNLEDGAEDWNYNGTLDANETSMIDVDTDNDGIIDSIELNWNTSSDNDTLINACDSDSDNDGVTDGNEIRVIFRTNAVNGEYNGSSWIAVALNQSAWSPNTEPPYGYDLTGFWYNSSSSNPIGILLGYTFENDEIRYDEVNETVYVNATQFLINTSCQIIKSTKPTLMFTKHRGEAIVFYNTSDGDNVYNVLDHDSDDDGLVDGFEDLDNDGVIDTYETDPYMQDTDMDGLPDGVEDSDLNGSRDYGETDPLNVDCDGDGLWDGWHDLDNDSVYDPFEYGEDTNANGTVDVGETDPLKLDTDDDLLRDDFEMVEDVFWMETEDYLVSGAQKNSTENASTGSEVEFQMLSEGTYQMCVMAKSIASDTQLTFEAVNATNVTLRSETVNLSVTYQWYNTSSFVIASTDLPIKLKAPSTGADANLRIDKIVFIKVDNLSLKDITNPSDDDSDDDGLLDANEKFIYQTHPFDLDSDGDGIQDGTELGITASQGSDTADTFKPDQEPNSTTNPLKIDTDNDGLPDGWVDGWGDFGIIDGFAQPIEGEDFNTNGKVNGRETNPAKIDSDCDGLNDTVEVMDGVYWFEAEDNNIGTIIENGTASTGAKITLPNPSVVPGSYVLYVHAKSNISDKQLLFGVYNDTSTLVNKTIILSNKYIWFNTTEFNITAQNLPVYLYAPYPNADSEIAIDKILLVRLSNELNYSLKIDHVTNSSLSFNSSENQTTYLEIPQFIYVKSATLIASGLPKNSSYPENITLDVGNDGDFEWYHAKKFFNNVTIPEFGDELNEYIFNNKGNFSNGSISIPLIFHSDTAGIINISNVQIILMPDVSCPMANDTDHDALIDRYEKNFYFTHCLKRDSDHDMIDDYQELYIDGNGIGTHPGLHDTDKDGLWDGWHDLNGNRIFDIIDEVGEDTNANFVVDEGETNPLDPDTDNDSLLDGAEMVPGVAWFEAEGYTVGEILSDSKASNNQTVKNSTGIILIRNDSFSNINLPLGDYLLYFKANSTIWDSIDIEYFSNGLGDWSPTTSGSTSIDANDGYLNVTGNAGNNETAYAENTVWNVPPSGDYIIEFDYRYPSGTTMTDFLIWGLYNTTGPDLEIWQRGDKLYANNDTVYFASLANSVWHHFKLVSMYGDTFQIYLDGALMKSGNKVEYNDSEIFGKIGDVFDNGTGKGRWDNIESIETSHLNITVETNESSISNETYILSHDYIWYSTSCFSVGSDGNISISVFDMDSTRSTAFLDKLALAKIDNSSQLIINTTTDSDDAVIFNSEENKTVYLQIKAINALPMYVVSATMLVNASYGFYNDGEPLFTDPYNQSRPAIYQDKVVYHDYDPVNGDTEIYMYNITSKTETKITTDSLDQTYPDIYGNYVVYMEEDFESNYRIVLYNISSTNQTIIDYSRYPRIHEDKIVYRGRYEDGKYIHLYNITTGNYTQINNFSSENPTIFGNIIVWTAGGYENEDDIYMYDLGPDGIKNTSDDGGEKLIANKTGCNYHADIYDKNVVWAEIVEAENISYIYLYKIDENSTYNISNVSSLKEHPRIFKNKIVWCDYRNGAQNPDIYLYDLDLDLENSITTNNYYQRAPDIWEEAIVWLDNRTDDQYDIYIYDYFSYPTYPYLNIGNKSNVSIPRANKNIKDFAKDGGLSQLVNMTLPDWAWYFGEFNKSAGYQLIFDFAGVLNGYTFANLNEPGMISESGYLNIPLVFHSDMPGVLLLTNINIKLAPYFSDPFCKDTDGDLLLDSCENAIYTYSLKWDSDNDGLWDVVEPVKGIKTDPLDSDTENDLLMDGNSDELKVIFRSGSSNGDFINYTEGSWIAVQKLVWIGDLSSYVPVSEYSRLLEYGFDRNASSLPQENASIIFNTTEGYELFYINSTHEIYVKLGENDYRVYNLNDADAQYAVNLTSPQPKYAIDNREVYSNAALTADKDNDGLIDGIEQSLGLTPSDADWDDDGLLDGIEYYLIGSNPKENDTDDDGLWDGLELGITLSDVWEIRWNLEVNELIYGTNLSVFSGHQDSDPNSTTNPLLKDTDKDGIWDGLNDLNGNGTADPNEPGEDRNLNGKSCNENETDPGKHDTDGDGLSDGFGEGWDGDIYLESDETNPLDVDTDNDGLWDGYSTSYDGVIYLGELSYGTAQRDTDSDNDYILDGTEVGLYFNGSDPENDTVLDDNEALQINPFLKGTNTSIFASDSDTLTVTNPTNNDTDDDGLEDGKEDENYDGYFEDNKNETDPLNKDTDFDGLLDGEEDLDKDGIFEESNNETSPNDADTDDDGLKDGSEIQRDSDTDEDGLINALDDDSDDDGILDGVEAGVTQNDAPGEGFGFYGTNLTLFPGDADPSTTTNPLDNDTDDDGLPDGWIDGWVYDWNYGWGNHSSANGIMELWEGEDFNCTGSYEPTNFIESEGEYLNETNPNVADTDKDGIPDGIEAYFDLNPLNASDAEEDLDTDSISNLEEWRHGLDTDNDQLVNFNDTNDDNDLMDTVDELYYGLNPYVDDMNLDLDKDGLSNGYEYNNSLDLSNPDTDGDNLWDGYHDDNGNGVLDWTDSNGNNKWDEGEGEKPGESHYGTNASDPDSDDDGIWDGDEVIGWYVFILPDFKGDIIVYHVVPNPLLSDEDDDNLNDWQEYENGTDPNCTDTDNDGLSDYKEIVDKDEEDPTVVELNPPRLQSKPNFGHELKTSHGIWVEKAWLNMWLSVEDDVEIKKIYVDVRDSDQEPELVFDGEEFTGWKVWAGYIESRKIELDFWQDITWEYIINITVIDVSNNSYSYFFIGGFKADFTGKVGSFIAEHSPFWGGFYTGFYEGLINTFGDAVKGTIDFLSILFDPNRWGEFWDMLSGIWDMIADYNLTAMIEGAVYQTIQRAMLFSPFTLDDPKWLEYRDGFVIGSGIGFVFATFSIIFVSVGIGVQNPEMISTSAAVRAGLNVYNFIQDLPVKLLGYVVKGLKWAGAKLRTLACNVIPKLKILMEKIKSGAARFMHAMKVMKTRSSNFFRNLGSKSDDVWTMADDEWRGCANALRSSKKMAADGGSASIRILKNSKLQWTDDMLRKLDNVVAEMDDVTKLSDEAIDGVGNVLKGHGKDAIWDAKNYVDDIGDIYDNMDGLFRDINELKKVKGSPRTIDDFFSQLKGDPLSAKGQAAEIRTAVDDIGASKIDEMAHRIPDTQYKADILTKTDPVTGKQTLVEVKNSNSFSNYQDKLKEQLLAYNKYKPDADLTVYVRSGQVNDVKSWALNEFEFNVNVKSIPGT